MKRIFLLFFMGLLFISCEKILDVKSRSSLAVPSKLADFQALLDDYRFVNHEQTSAAEISADDYYVSYQDWQTVPENERQMYVWGNDQIYASMNDWREVYRLIYSCNLVIEGMSSLQSSFNKMEFDNVMGQAFFHRARAFYNGVTIWSLAYDPITKDHELGLPLRLDPDFNQPSVRSTIGETYNQIINDLKVASDLLPDHASTTYRPSRVVAYALISKVYLSMGEYGKAYEYADSVLSVNRNLLDFNKLNDGKIPYMNPEIIFYSQLSTGSFRFLWQIGLKIPEALYSMYEPEDLRKNLYFSDINGEISFIGNFNTESVHLFSGITTSEIFLVFAECAARLGKYNEAKATMKQFLTHRYKDDGSELVLTVPNDALVDFILAERRKELLLRGIRWSDIKRLNREGYNISLVRELDGEIFGLPPNSRRFALPIPEDVILLSGMKQNSY